MAKLHAEPLVQSFAFYRLGSFFIFFFSYFFKVRKFLTFYSSLKSIKTSYTKLNHLKLFYRTLFFNLWDNLFKSFFSKNCRLTVRRALVLIQVEFSFAVFCMSLQVIANDYTFLQLFAIYCIFLNNASSLFYAII